MIFTEDSYRAEKKKSDEFIRKTLNYLEKDAIRSFEFEQAKKKVLVKHEELLKLLS